MSARAPRGLAVVEMTLVMPLLLVILFAAVDWGRAILARQVLINISREAANLSSRGTSLSDAIAAVQASARPLDLAGKGYVILTEVQRDSHGAITVHARAASGGKPQSSRVGGVVGGPASLPPSNPPVPPNGQSVYVAEVFYVLAPVTPIGHLLGIQVGQTYYDVAYF